MKRRKCRADFLTWLTVREWTARHMVDHDLFDELSRLLPGRNTYGIDDAVFYKLYALAGRVPGEPQGTLRSPRGKS